jgi:hypothetical protein
MPRPHRVAATLVLLTSLALASACSGRAVQGAHAVLVGEKARPVSAGQLFGGQFLQVHAPASPGWVLLRESSKEITFARPGTLARETYVAMVSFFALAAMSDPGELVAHVRAARDADSPPDRFADAAASYEYSEERGYPCVKYVSSARDVKAPGGALTLAERGMYCRHPKSEGTGFWVSYSQRALKPDADLVAQADSFIAGVVVPSGSAEH